jgi:NitT/TauT family transport system substrate-binding protein
VDLKGKRVSAGAQAGSEERLFVSAMATYVGLDPANDIEWVTDPSTPAMQLFLDGKVDALLSFPPETQEMHTKNVGHVVVSGTLDRPWSQYFCCMVNCRAGYAEKYPVATKHVLRAILKATDLCVSDPALVARTLVEAGDAKDYDLTMQVLSDVPFAKWRGYDPEDTMRFFSLRLHEAGMIESSPQNIIANGTDWRFLNELKRELKA